ncbi:MAG: TerB family tellurite resistance protein [Polaromonas sp.]|nr:TerB family tellurite resistance protein [Polaromonas sp.]
MLTTLKDLFQTLVQAPGEHSSRDGEHALRLATAVLLVEVMRADTHMQPDERESVLAGLREKFGLAKPVLDELLAEAEQQARSAHDYHRFTSLLNGGLSHPQKIQVIENMWRVAYADTVLDANENHLIGKIAGLLHVTHGEYIAAKLHAKEAAAMPVNGRPSQGSAPSELKPMAS